MSHDVCRQVLILLMALFLDLLFNKIYITCIAHRKEGCLIFCPPVCNFISQTEQNNFDFYLSKQLSVKECPADYHVMTDLICFLTGGN